MNIENIVNESTNVNKYENIVYKKSNPFILGSLSSNSKFHLAYNIIKGIILLLVFIFALLTLWYTTQWKDNTLTNLGIDLQSKLGGDATSNPDLVAKIEQANLLSLSDWSIAKSSISNSIIDLLVAFSFVGIVAVIPSLVFKNGTIYSVISIAIAFISLIVILVLFFMCISAANPVVQIYRTVDWTNQAEKIKNIQNILDKVLGTQVINY